MVYMVCSWATDNGTLAMYEVDNSTFDQERVLEYIESCLGAKHLPVTVVLPITIVYVAIFVSGVIGNLCVCLVILKNAELQSATNYYLFSLAVSDLSLLILGLPNELSVYFQQYPYVLGQTLCKCRALVSEMASYTSVLTIVAFSTERYIAICHPLYLYTMTGFSRAMKVIAAVWIVSFVFAFPFAMFTKINYLHYPPGSDAELHETAFCAMLSRNIPGNWPIYELSCVIFFLIPMIVILALYMKIGRCISARRQMGSGVDGAIHRDKKAIIKMLSAVVITFFICWFPFHAQRLFYLYGSQTGSYEIINEYAFYVAGVLYYVSATVNPILYNLMSTKYRTAFKKTLLCYVPSDHMSRKGTVTSHTNNPRYLRRIFRPDVPFDACDTVTRLSKFGESCYCEPLNVGCSAYQTMNLETDDGEIEKSKRSDMNKCQTAETTV